MSEGLAEVKRQFFEEGELSVSGFEYLLAQAERFEILAEQHDKALAENQRYKQALEKIATRKMSVYINKESMLNDFIKIANEALEVDTQ